MNITVVGSHEVRLQPDRAQLRLGVSFEADAKEVVLRATTQVANQLKRKIESLAGDDSDPIERFALEPVRTRSWRPFHDQGRILPMRYAASTSFSITFRDFVALATLGDETGAIEGVTLDGVDWQLTDDHRRAIEDEVLAEAVRLARRRALVIAEAEGHHHVDAVEVADPGLLGSGREELLMSSAPFFARAVKDAGGSGLELVPQDIVVAISVHARFQTR